MKLPDTRYADSSGMRIAYQVIGQGPMDLVFVPGFMSNLEVHWEDPSFTHLMRRLSTFTRLIVFDKRGTGLSDRIDHDHLPSLERRMDDVRAVMDAAGSGRAALLGASDGAALSILFAATHPERTRALVLYGGYAHFHTSVMAADALHGFIRDIETSWGNGAGLARFAPSRERDEPFRAWWGRLERLSGSPTAAIALACMNAQIDVREMLPRVRAPTLVVHRGEDGFVKPAAGRYLAEKIAGARLVELAGRDHPMWTGDVDRIVDEFEEFLTGARAASAHNRVLATLMVARLVARQRPATQFGDRHWPERIDTLQTAASEAISRHGGKPISAGTETITARFDSPVRAIRCALAIREAANALDLQLAAGIHAGEIEVRADSVAGRALHVTERIAVEAAAHDILVSGVVSDLVAGSGLHFGERPSATIEGLDTPLQLRVVAPEEHLQPTVRARTAPDLNTLSAREREVVTLVADGLSNAVIAEKLRLSEHTVKRHVANILLKLDLPTRAAAAALIGREDSHRVR